MHSVQLCKSKALERVLGLCNSFKSWLCVPEKTLRVLDCCNEGSTLIKLHSITLRGPANA
jgi:hypothetical protein